MTPHRPCRNDRTTPMPFSEGVEKYEYILCLCLSEVVGMADCPGLESCGASLCLSCGVLERTLNKFMFIRMSCLDTTLSHLTDKLIDHPSL